MVLHACLFCGQAMGFGRAEVHRALIMAQNREDVAAEVLLSG